jgi:hypothetical protein
MVRVDDLGNMGIGKSNPAVNLDVSGSIAASCNIVTSNLFSSNVYTSNLSASFTISSSNMYCSNLYTSNVIATGSGNFTGTLTAIGAVTGGSLRVPNSVTIGANNTISFTGQDTPIVGSWGILYTGATTQPFKLSNSSLLVGYTTIATNWGTDMLMVASNVGCGLSNPRFPLHVIGNGGTAIQINPSTANTPGQSTKIIVSSSGNQHVTPTTLEMGMEGSTLVTGNVPYVNAGFASQSAADKLSFRIDGIERMYIDRPSGTTFMTNASVPLSYATNMTRPDGSLIARLCVFGSNTAAPGGQATMSLYPGTDASTNKDVMMKIFSSGTADGSPYVLEMGVSNIGGMTSYLNAYVVSGGVPTASPMSFRVAGAEAMRINADRSLTCSSRVSCVADNILGLSSGFTVCNLQGINQNLNAPYHLEGLIKLRSSNSLYNAISVLSNDVQTAWVRTDGTAAFRAVAIISTGTALQIIPTTTAATGQSSKIIVSSSGSGDGSPAILEMGVAGTANVPGNIEPIRSNIPYINAVFSTNAATVNNSKLSFRVDGTERMYIDRTTGTTFMTNASVPLSYATNMTNPDGSLIARLCVFGSNTSASGGQATMSLYPGTDASTNKEVMMKIFSSGTADGSPHVLEMGVSNIGGMTSYLNAYVVSGGVPTASPMSFRVTGAEAMRINADRSLTCSSRVSCVADSILGLSSGFTVCNIPAINQNFSPSFTNEGLIKLRSSNSLYNAISVLSNDVQTAWVRTDGTAAFRATTVTTLNVGTVTSGAINNVIGFLSGNVGIDTNSPSAKLTIIQKNAAAILVLPANDASVGNSTKIVISSSGSMDGSGTLLEMGVQGLGLGSFTNTPYINAGSNSENGIATGLSLRVHGLEMVLLDRSSNLTMKRRGAIFVNDDNQHGIAFGGTNSYFGTDGFGSLNVGGPVVFGNTEGALGTRRSMSSTDIRTVADVYSLRWYDTGNVMVRNNLIVNGNVGIGAASPTYKLEVSGTAYVSGILTANGGVSGNVSGNVTGSSGSCTGNAATATTAGNLTGSPAITVGTVTSGVINNVIGFSAGNVGIDTTSPTYKLEVNGSFAASLGKLSGYNWEMIDSWGARYTGTKFQPFSVKNASLVVGTPQDGTEYGTGNVWANTVYTDNGLRLAASLGPTHATAQSGIWFSTPQTLLIPGAASTSGWAPFSFEDYSDNVGTGWYFSWNSQKRFKIDRLGVTSTISDRQLKEDITVIPNALDRLTSTVSGVYYHMKSDTSRTRQIGCIAQDVQVEFPELVAKNSDGLLMLNYTGLSAILIECVRTLKSKMDAQAQQMDALAEDAADKAVLIEQTQSELAQLKQEMLALKSMIVGAA